MAAHIPPLNHADGLATAAGRRIHTMTPANTSEPMAASHRKVASLPSTANTKTTTEKSLLATFFNMPRRILKETNRLRVSIQRDSVIKCDSSALCSLRGFVRFPPSPAPCR